MLLFEDVARSVSGRVQGEATTCAAFGKQAVESLMTDGGGRGGGWGSLGTWAEAAMPVHSTQSRHFPQSLGADARSRVNARVLVAARCGCSYNRHHVSSRGPHLVGQAPRHPIRTHAWPFVYFEPEQRNRGKMRPTGDPHSHCQDTALSPSIVS